MSGYRNYISYGPKKTHLLILKPFRSKEFRAATATTGKIETPTSNILSWKARMSGYRNYIGYGPKKTHLLILKPFGSKEIRAATATTGKIETLTSNILSWEARMSGYRNYNGYGPKKTAPVYFKALMK